MTYIVRAGDTLYHLALTHGVTVADLEAANHLPPTGHLRVGQVLRIPMPAAAGPQRPPITEEPARPPAAGAPAVPATPGDSAVLGQRITAAATAYLGTPYVWGGAGPAGVDCSGLVYLVYAPYVPRIPRLSYDQWTFGRPVDAGDLAPGDLVFFDTDGTGASHVGIYIGDGQFVHPAARAHRVVVDRLDMPYYASHYLGARRVL